MRWFRFAVLISLVAILQASLFDIIAVTTANIRPDLLLILLVFFAICRVPRRRKDASGLGCNTSQAIVTSFAIGFAADIIGSTMGPQTISFGLFGTALAYLHHVITVRKMPYQSLVIFITALLAGTLVYFLTFLKGQPTATDAYAIIFGSSLYSSLVGPFLFLPAAWWMRIKTRRFSRVISR